MHGEKQMDSLHRRSLINNYPALLEKQRIVNDNCDNSMMITKTETHSLLLNPNNGGNVNIYNGVKNRYL